MMVRRTFETALETLNCGCFQRHAIEEIGTLSNRCRRFTGRHNLNVLTTNSYAILSALAPDKSDTF